jgi:hypothetical protein
MPIYGKPVPLNERPTRTLWFGIVWCFLWGVSVLVMSWGLVRHLTLNFASLLLSSVVVLFESVACISVWQSVVELRRRKRGPSD